MKAVVLTGFGGPDKLEIREIAEPSPGPGQVKIRVAATSVNPVDWKMRRGGYKRGPLPEEPIVLGRDVAGEVVEVGDGVNSFRPGDRAMGFVTRAYAEFVVASADALAKVPEGLGLDAAAAIPLVATTGFELIDEQIRPSRGDTFLVTGAVGGVGRSAVFAAKRRGARVLAGVRSRQKSDAATLGVDGVVAIDDDGEIGSLPALDAIADTVDGDTIERLLPHLKKGGILGSVLGDPGHTRERGIEVRAFMAHPDRKILEEAARAAAEGKLEIPIGRRMALADVAEAHRLAEAGGVGKILLTP